MSTGHPVFFVMFFFGDFFWGKFDFYVSTGKYQPDLATRNLFEVPAPILSRAFQELSRGGGGQWPFSLGESIKSTIGWDKKNKEHIKTQHILEQNMLRQKNGLQPSMVIFWDPSFWGRFCWT